MKEPSTVTGHPLSRRRFISTGAGAATVLVMKPELVRGSQANSKIALGLIGCGGRGAWIADLFLKHGGYELVAVHDYFADRVNACGDKFNVPQNRRFTGLAGYKQLLESKVDAVAIISPPYFHPEQAAAGVAAGVHVYLAKPIAVDVPGCQSVAASGKKATDRKQCFLVDFQTRTDPYYQEAIKRVQYGDIGRIVCGEAVYIAGFPFDQQIKYLRADPMNPENRLRAWGVSRALSGDIITEQNIHAIDVATWVLDAHPIRAVGTGGRKTREFGDCWDHFSVQYIFPSDVLVTFHSKQFGQGWDDIGCRMYGPDGAVDTHYAGAVSIRGKTPYRGGESPNLYEAGAVANIATFHQDVTRGDYSNATVPPSVRSNLTTILGRTAAYRQGEATWEEMMQGAEKLEADLSGLV